MIDEELRTLSWTDFPLNARLAWKRVSPARQEAALSSAYCESCGRRRRMRVTGGELGSGALILRGVCLVCDAEVELEIAR